MKNVFTCSGRWWKGNTHAHTTNSDGQFRPEEICPAYRDAGYDFLCITDHHKITRDVYIPEDFLVIPGAELNNDAFHVVAIGLEEIFSEEEMSHQEIVDGILARDAIPIIAHPYWSALTSQDILRLTGYTGIEVYNNVTEVIRGKGYSSVHWDEILQNGTMTWGMAADDTHAKETGMASWIMVKTPSLTPENIYAALRGGLFYSSTGVTIENVGISGDLITVACSPAVSIDFIGYGATGNRVFRSDGSLTGAEHRLKGNEKYLRVEITDGTGKKAWTNPLWTEADG